MQNKLYVLLENIRSAYNVGSVFRTCESAGVNKLYLTGCTAYPPHPKLNKTALGSINSTPWEYQESPLKAAKEIKRSGIRLIVLESDKRATSIFSEKFEKDICLVFGNEIDGVSREIIKQSDQILTIPQFGKKESLNVSVAAGIAIYEFIRKSLTT